MELVAEVIAEEGEDHLAATLVKEGYQTLELLAVPCLAVAEPVAIVPHACADVHRENVRCRPVLVLKHEINGVDQKGKPLGLRLQA